MKTATLWTEASDLVKEDYCVLGLAICFVREEGEVQEVKIIEPIPSAALEAIVQGIPTSYQLACAKTLNEIVAEDTFQIPSEFPQAAQFCVNFAERLIAATRTYKSRPQAQQHIPLGTIKQDLNFSLDKKRVLNVTNVVRTEDNVKQHKYTHQVL
ncbi:hypothetical protein STA3757_11790 [Stanieria sp. NIES-3757]|nr:hypothetical protein STA3757_11790 [Stanieria sp. NIES-3757]